MSDETKDEGGESKPERNPHLEQATKDRDRLKNENRTLKERLSKLEEAESKLSEYESAKEAETAELERKKNDFAAQEKRWAKQLEDQKKTIDELTGWKTTRERTDREAALVDAVSLKLGHSNKALVKGLLRVAADAGFELPETLEDSIVVDAAKRIRELGGPDVFRVRSNGSPGTPGVNDTNRPPDGDERKQRVKALAKRLSGGQRPATKKE